MSSEIIKYNLQEINKAGRILRDNKSSKEEIDKCLEILDTWREIHSYPLHIFQMRLKDKASKIDKNSIVAQRLKRVSAIIFKLQRSYNGKKPSMKLHQMQDIGGCRAVVSNVSQIKELYNKYYLKGDIKHKKIGFKDYINYPKDDGYRGIHIIYKFYSDKGKDQYNDLLIEIQIRSKLQHIWATSVETVDFVTRQAIKSNEGHPEWKEFFKLISSAFAIQEHTPTIKNTPLNSKELYSKIKEKVEKLNVIEKMIHWTGMMKVLYENIKSINKNKKIKFFLLELDIIGSKLDIITFNEDEEQKAIEQYALLEKRHVGKKDYDVVLVGVDTIKDLKKAYPNYFVDTTEFLVQLKKILLISS